MSPHPPMMPLRNCRPKHSGSGCSHNAMALVLPAEFENDIAGLRRRLYTVQTAFQKANFSNLTESFNAYHADLDSIRGKMRVFLGVNPGK